MIQESRLKTFFPAKKEVKTPMRLLLFVGTLAAVALLGKALVRTEKVDKWLWRMRGYEKYPEPSPISHPEPAPHRNSLARTLRTFVLRTYSLFRVATQ